MKKLYILLTVMCVVLGGLFHGISAEDVIPADTSQTSVAEEPSVPDIDVLATINQASSSPNRIWVGTFQIVWNEVMNNLVYGPIRFADYNSKMARELNKQSFKETNISDNSYYTNFGVVSPDLKREIEQGIKAKFNETSDILDSFDWTKDDKRMFFYAMLKKDFKFLSAFDKLSKGGFGNNYNQVSYFGINKKSNKKLDKTVSVLFYNSYNDFAVKLYTKDNDYVLLYRTDEDKTFDNYYLDLKKKSKTYTENRSFSKNDELRIPDINLYKVTGFADVEGHIIKGTNFKIDKTIETIDFKMNKEGVKLKSEAAIMMMTTSLMPEEVGRKFYFTDNFVLFLIEKGQKTPYFAMKVADVETLNKTGKN